MSGNLNALDLSFDSGIATVRLRRGKVNALVPEVLDDIAAALRAVQDAGARAVVLTGSGPFFSFGFDVPHMLHWPRERFGAFITSFCTLYRRLFLLPMPVIAAVNGHAVAGGCILALAADYRVMAREKARIGLNEITFGASIFAGTVEMLRFHVGGRIASRLLLEGQLLDAEEAMAVGLVDEAVASEGLPSSAREAAERLSRNSDAFAGMKRLLRGDVGRDMEQLEPDSIESFLDVWYSPETQKQLPSIVIR